MYLGLIVQLCKGLKIFFNYFGKPTLEVTFLLITIARDVREST